jgi:serine protease Do
MKKSKLLIVLIMCLLVSCAHKSGHKRLNRSAESATERESVRTPDSEDNVTSATAEYGDNNEILNGKTIFNRYGNAVFMVFTTDGTNTYQGSGFFINSHGLAVSNYHVFKGTAIGAEQIKLVGSDTAYKVTKVIKSDEEEDFILKSATIIQYTIKGRFMSR